MTTKTTSTTNKKVIRKKILKPISIEEFKKKNSNSGLKKKNLYLVV